MKRTRQVIMCLFVSSCFVQAKLKLRQNRARQDDGYCCHDLRTPYEPTTVVQAEDEVNRLRQEAIKAYDEGEYMFGMDGWSKKRQKALDIQTKLGYTVPEDFEWGD